MDWFEALKLDGVKLRQLTGVDHGPWFLEDNMSLGEDRVRIAFNPSNSDPVADIKQRAAELIDICNEWPKPADPAKAGEFNRLIALALTCFEDGAMWAVKAVTTPTG